MGAGDRAAADDTAFYDSVYGACGGQLAATIRAEVFDEGIGQNSWVTADEYRRYFAWLGLLRPGGLALFTDPLTVTGLIRREEMVVRSGSLGLAHVGRKPR